MPRAKDTAPIEEPDAKVPAGTIQRPLIDVLERSLQSPFGLPTAQIDLIESGFLCHWVNTELKGGDQLRYFLDAGYLKCRTDYLKHPEFVTFTESPDGYVCRGSRCQEVLMYTTIEHAKQRTKRKQEENIRRMSNPNVSAQDAAQAASQHIGDEAAEYLSRHSRPVGTVTDSLERVEQTRSQD
jgi:hypothetical protein